MMDLRTQVTSSMVQLADAGNSAPHVSSSPATDTGWVFLTAKFIEAWQQTTPVVQISVIFSLVLLIVFLFTKTSLKSFLGKFGKKEEEKPPAAAGAAPSAINETLNRISDSLNMSRYEEIFTEISAMKDTLEKIRRGRLDSDDVMKSLLSQCASSVADLLAEVRGIRAGLEDHLDVKLPVVNERRHG
jgi:hypothetical protein